jgi:hypothetical protein
MKKLSIAIAVLAAAVVSAGSVTHNKNSSPANRPTVPSTIQADLPAPSCPPACALPAPSRIPD